MFALAHLDLPNPVTLTTSGGRRATIRTFSRLELCFDFVPAFRTIYAQIAGVPNRLLIYGPDDWPFVLADSPEDHATRVGAILGGDPAAVLQALLEGRELPALPPRVPRELPNWRLKAALLERGLLDAANAAIDSLGEPLRSMALLAWNGDTKCERNSTTVEFIASKLGLTDAALDALFIAAEHLQI